MRKLALSLAVLLAMPPRASYALGLGDIDLHSALDETLNAEIHLLSVQPGDLDQATVRLASNEAYTRAGVERLPVLNGLTFEIMRQRDGTPIIKVSSSQPVRDPTLDFLIEVNWPAGRLVREYTLLLDPPVVQEKAPPVVRPLASAPATPVEALSRSAPAPVRTEARAAPAVPHGGGTVPAYGPTRRTDTLWNVAKQVRPSDTVSIHQMMVALLRNNPEAFYNGNVNSLKAGYILRVPEREWIAKISNPEAMREVTRQYQEWLQARRGAAPAAKAEPQPRQQAGQTPAPAKTGASAQEDKTRLRLVPPTDAKAAAGGKAGKGSAEVALAMEAVDATQRENQELRQRLQALEQKLGSLQQSMVTIKDEGAPAAPAAAEQPAPAPAVQKPAAKPAQPTTVPQAPSAATPQFWTNPAVVGGLVGVLMVLGGASLFLARRRRMSGTGREDEVLTAAMTELAPKAPRAAPAEPAPVRAAAPAPAAPAAPAAPVVAQVDDVEAPAAEIDPVVEADVYLAYRRYFQAEALMEDAIKRDPGNLEYRAKLLEIYYASKNAEGFAVEAEQFYEKVGRDDANPIWARVKAMGQDLCAGHPLFSAGAAGAGISGAAGGLDEGLGMDETASSAFSGMGMDFSVGEDISASAAQALPAETPAPVADTRPEDNGLDFDLGGWTAPAASQPGLGDVTAMPAAANTDTGQGGLALEVDTPPAPAAKAPASWEIKPAVSEFHDIDFTLDDGDLLAGTDVIGTKLDLARAYIDMGDSSSARDILKEIVAEGNEAQKQEAQALMQGIV